MPLLVLQPLARYPHSIMMKPNSRLRDGRNWGLKTLGMSLVLGVLVVLVSVPLFAIRVSFPDPNLESAVSIALGQPAGDIQSTDLEGLTSLDARFLGITTLEGLQYCTNLTELKLFGNEITDISVLSNLVNLTSLQLDNNQISDISALSNLTNLKLLSLSNNNIVDVAALSTLIKLETLLSLSKNRIVDISSLSNLTKLIRLDLVDNEIVDISALSTLTRLTGLGLGGNQIVDISPIADLTELTKIWLSGNQITGILTLVEGGALNAGDWIDIRFNCLDLRLGARDMLDVDSLRSRGVSVVVEPQGSCNADIGVAAPKAVLNVWLVAAIGVAAVVLVALLLL